MRQIIESKSKKGALEQIFLGVETPLAKFFKCLEISFHIIDPKERKQKEVYLFPDIKDL